MCVFIYVFICIYLFRSSLLVKQKRYRPKIRYTYSHRLYLKTGFWFFSKEWPWRPLASKNFRVTWIFRISPRLPCFSIILAIFSYFWIWAHHSTWRLRPIFKHIKARKGIDRMPCAFWPCAYKNECTRGFVISASRP